MSTPAIRPTRDILASFLRTYDTFLSDRFDAIADELDDLDLDDDPAFAGLDAADDSYDGGEA